MQYLGGKSRLGGRIVQAILADLGVKRLTLAVDLCTGAGNVACRLADVADKVIAVEAHPGLVALHKAVQAGWVPPEHVSEEEYQTQRTADPVDALTAFVGFGCSFGGKWWGGYARSRTTVRNYAREGSAAARRRRRANVDFVVADALAWPCEAAEVVYCDPPYAGTTGYDAVAEVAIDVWWYRLAALAGVGRACYLSEYADAPPAGIEARLIWTGATHGGQLTKGGRNIERLWRVLGYTAANDGVNAQNAPATPSEVAPPCKDPSNPAEPATGPQGAREVATLPTASDSDPWDTLPPMMPIAA